MRSYLVRSSTFSVIAAALLLGGAVASAQTSPPPDSQPAYDPSMSGQPMAAEPAPMAAQAPPPEVTLAEPMDGPRFRFGFSGGFGIERVTNDPYPTFSAWNVGFDFRLGVQLNDLIGIYVQPHLSGGKGSYEGGLSGGTGVFAVTGMVDFTLADQVAFGAGFGYGVLNNPTGPALAFRAAWYPVVSRSPLGPRRKGLMVGADMRVIFSDVGTGIQFIGSVGYEAF